nr:integrase, catalytic region, zinc finger, CCHC-type, peptidase aspartic, catalytic [Tanacetum cinerariifolium]
MRDANPIRTLGDYSGPSHEGYRNTIELLEGNNVVPLRFDTIQRMLIPRTLDPSPYKRILLLFMASQDARLSKFEADFKQQQREMTNKIDTVFTDRMAGELPSDTVKNLKLNVNSTSLVFSARSYPTVDPQFSQKVLGNFKPFDTLADLGACVNIIPLNLFKKLNIRLLEETNHVFGLANGNKSYPIRIVKDVEVHIGRLKLLCDFYVIDMKKDLETPLLVGRGFLAIANAVIDCRKAKITVREGITWLVFGVKEIELGDQDHEVPVNETFHEQTNNELTENELKKVEVDDQAIQTTLLGLPEDIYAAVDSYEAAQEIWLCVKQMMKGSYIGIPEKKAKLFNEWERPNQELIHYCLESPPYELGWKEKFVLDSEGNPTTATEKVFETYKNVKQEIRDQLNAKAEAVQIILTGIDNDIYSTVDACPNACEMWKAIERLKQCESINVQDLETNLFWEFGKFTSLDGESLESRNQCKVKKSSSECLVFTSIATRMAEHSSTRTQHAATRNRGKAIVNSPQPIYDQEPSMVDDDDETSKEKEIDKLMALISLSNARYESQRSGNVARARETVGSSMVQKSGIQCYNCKEYGHVARECQKPKRAKDAAYHREKMLLCKQEEAGIQLNADQADWKDDTDDESDDQELEAHYMYMAKIQEVSPDAVDSGPIFDTEPEQKLIEIILFIVDAGCSKHMTGNLKLLINFVEKFLGTVKFGNDQIAPILGYGDLVQEAVTIKRVYYVEGMNHNLFSVGQFCDADLEVAFRKSTCFIRDLKGNDLLSGSHGSDLYSITLQGISSPNLICLMAKATSSQAWLWHRRLSHLNFDTINLLSKNDIVMEIEGNTRDLGSFREETDEITDLQQIHEEVLLTARGDGVAGITRRRHDPSGDGVRDLVTVSGRGRLNEDLESST